MKKAIFIISIITLFFVGCKKDDIAEASKVRIETETIEKGWDYVKINVEYDYPVVLEAVSLYLSEKEDMSDANVYECNVEGKKYSVELDSLKAGVAYYYCYEYDNGYEKEKCGKKSMQTISKPVVVTDAATNVTPTTAVLKGSVTNNDSGNKITEMGLCWGTEHEPAIEGEHYNKGIGNAEGTTTFTYNLVNLQDDVTYYFRSYVVTSLGIVYGEEKSFTTVEIVLPTVTTNAVTNIKATTATCGGYVSSDGNGTVTARGICWSTKPNPTISDSKTTDGSGTGSFTSYMSGLQDGTTYYVRAYATNEKGTAYGEEKSFATLKKVLPTVTTNAVTNIKATTATCGGYVSSDGNATVTARGICWSTKPNPTINDNKINNGSGTGSFTSYMSGLQDGTTYYVRAYATNEKGTSYGEEKTFTTVEIVLPIITTNTVTNITTNSATCGGNVTYDGNATVTARGVCWGTSPNPTIEKDNKINNGSGTGSFKSYMSGLKDGTTYYVRAYASNKKGTSYGEERTFTTLEFSNETITVNGVSFTMIAVEGGAFSMGGATSEQGSDADSDERPVHSVTLSDYYIGETEVTQELWQAVMGNNPSYYSGYPQRPVEYVSWNDCQEFITKLNNLTGKNFRLPTEAEWEYAARGGNKSKGYKYSGSNTVGDVAWYDSNSISRTHDVKTKQANELGIYDMSGNVYEWCQDWYNSSYYSSSPENNPTGPTSGSSRVLRGGSWDSDARFCRVSSRRSDDPDFRDDSLGFRLAL